MGRFARLFKCICAIVALGILITGLAAQVEQTAEVSLSTGSAVLTASISEDYTDPSSEHKAIRRGTVLSAVEVSRETAGSSSNETLARRVASSGSTAVNIRIAAMLSMILAAAIVSSSISRPVVHAEGSVHSAEQTIISYIHSQGNFIG